MNFLAHLALSGDNQMLIMGNYVADFIKGRVTQERIETWPENFGKGILLHRAIDDFTDHHPGLLQMKTAMSPEFGKWSGVVADIFFDYFLANNFEMFYPMKLDTFVKEMHDVIECHFDLIPIKMQPMAQAMIDYQWLLGYKEVKGIQDTFTNLSKRNSMRDGLYGAERSLLANKSFYESYFFSFYPQLQQITTDFLKQV